jgi:predicted nucleotidyltransferase
VLHRLVEHGLVSAQEAGAATLFTLNREHVAAAVVDELARLRTELIERIRGEVQGWDSQPIHVSIFGSAARGDGSTTSDIDLLIVRPEQVSDDDAQWREQLHGLAEHIHRWSGNHASLHELTPRDLRAALRRREPIIVSLRKQSIAVAGPDFADLATCGRKVA